MQRERGGYLTNRLIKCVENENSIHLAFCYIQKKNNNKERVNFNECKLTPLKLEFIRVLCNVGLCVSVHMMNAMSVRNQLRPFRRFGIFKFASVTNRQCFNKQHEQAVRIPVLLTVSNLILSRTRTRSHRSNRSTTLFEESDEKKKTRVLNQFQPLISSLLY